IGDKRPALAALVVPDEGFMKEWAKANNKPPDLTVLCQEKIFHAALAPAVDRANKRLSSIEQVRRFAISPTPFTTQNAMMTPSLKIRRHVISKQFAQILERLYQRG
ncbi:MAG: long-chain fatty acid--CoA ligase, partial [Alphaproteobacteria bacterium]